MDFRSSLQGCTALGADSYGKVWRWMPAGSHRYRWLSTGVCGFCCGADCARGRHGRGSTWSALNIERHGCLSNSRPSDRVRSRDRTLSIGPKCARSPQACLAFALGPRWLSGGAAAYRHGPFFMPMGLAECPFPYRSLGRHTPSDPSLLVRIDTS